MKRFLMIVSLLFCFMVPNAGAAIATFDDLMLASDSSWNGSDGSGAFKSGETYFSNNYTAAWGSWDGWAYSNTTNMTTPGPANQYSAITGGGSTGSANYGIAYVGWASNPNLTFDVTGENFNTTISGMYVTNTTFAALSMLNGDSFAKKFGGVSGDDEDWFKLSVTGITIDGSAPFQEFYLADYRFADNSEDYIVNEWEWVDLSGLGDVVGLEFSLSSSDVGAYGMNTPAYFAIDDLNGSPVPVPGAIWLMASGLVGLAGLRRRKG